MAKTNAHKQLYNDTLDLLNQLSIKLEAVSLFDKEHSQVGTPINRVEDHKFLQQTKEQIDKILAAHEAGDHKTKDEDEDDYESSDDYYDSTCN